jgi:hypothetical protein
MKTIRWSIATEQYPRDHLAHYVLVVTLGLFRESIIAVPL